MNIENLAESFKPWMRVETWNTSHPMDSKRFHKALSHAFSENGLQLSYDDFKDAMFNLADSLYPGKYEATYLEQCIVRYAENAEIIACYLADIKI